MYRVKRKTFLRQFALACAVIVTATFGSVYMTASLIETPSSFGSQIEDDVVQLLTSFDLSTFVEESRKPPSVPEELHFAAPDYTVEADNAIAVYLSAPSMRNEEFRQKTIQRLLDTGGNALVFDVKGSYVYFHTDASVAEEIGLIRPMYELPEILAEARSHGLRTIGRYIVAKDPNLAQREPEVQIRHPETGISVGNVWIDTSHPRVIDYNRQIIAELVRAGIDEINFDYIRYPTEYAQYRIGLTGTEKADRIIQFLQMAREEVERQNSDTLLGISTFAILGWNYDLNMEPLGQDVIRFAPYVDIISPMAYPSTFAEGAYYHPSIYRGTRFYSLVHRTLLGYKKFLGPKESTKLRPWIQGYSVKPLGLQHQAEAVFDAGLCGFMIWNARNDYARYYTAMEYVEIPLRCRSEN